MQVLVGSAVPVGMLVQVPSVPVRLQATHAPVQAVWQQIPWLQNNPLAHSPMAEQVAPAGLGPHELLRQEFSPLHCVVSVQLVKHLVPLQT